MFYINLFLRISWNLKYIYEQDNFDQLFGPHFCVPGKPHGFEQLFGELCNLCIGLAEHMFWGVICAVCERVQWHQLLDKTHLRSTY